MHGFEWKSQRGLEGTGFVRAIRELLTAQLPHVMTRLSQVISDQINTEVQKGKVKNGWHRVPLFATAKQIATRANCAVFFPDELGMHIPLMASVSRT